MQLIFTQNADNKNTMDSPSGKENNQNSKDDGNSYSREFHRPQSYQSDGRRPERRERKSHGKPKIQSPSELRFPESVNVDKDYIYCVVRNVHKFDILFQKSLLFAHLIGRLGLLEYVDNSSLVRACNLSPELADKIYDQVEKKCYTTCGNPRYVIW